MKGKRIKVLSLVAVSLVLVASYIISIYAKTIVTNVSGISAAGENLSSAIIGDAGTKQTVVDLRAPIIQETNFALEGSDIVRSAMNLLGKPYVWSGKAGAYNNVADPVNQIPGVDCSGLVAYSLNKSGYVIKGLTNPYSTYTRNNLNVPVDTAHWMAKSGVYYKEAGIYTRSSKDKDFTFKYAGANINAAPSIYNNTEKLTWKVNNTSGKINILKVGDPISSDLRWFEYYDAEGNKKTLPTGTIVVSYGENGKNHAWISIGDLGTANAEEARKILNEKYNIDINANTIYSKGDSTYWMIESSNGGVRINNNNPDYLYAETFTDAKGKVITKKIGTIWAYQIAGVPTQEPVGQYAMQIAKASKKDNSYLAGAEFKIGYRANETDKVLYYDDAYNAVASEEARFVSDDKVSTFAVQNITDTTKADIYTIEEFKAPTGYVVSGEGKQLTIKVNKELNENENVYRIASVEVNGNIVNEAILLDSEFNVTTEESNYIAKVEVLNEESMQMQAVRITWRDEEEVIPEGTFKLAVIKQDSKSDKKLTGAKFKVTVKNSKTGEILKDWKDRKLDGTEEYTVNRTTGVLSFFGVNINKEDEEYDVTIEETKAPEGYNKIDGTINFKVKSKLNEAGDKYELVPEEMIVENTKKVEVLTNEVNVTVPNTKIPTGNFTLNIKKIDSENDEFIAGAGFKVKVEEKETGKTVVDSEKKELNGEETYYVNDTDGTLTFSYIDLRDTTYVVTINEDVVPKGYIGIDGAISFEATAVEEDGEYKLTPATLTVENAKSVSIDNNEVEVVVGNTLFRELDLALRKSITAVSGNPVVNGYNLLENRLPEVDARSAQIALVTGNAEYYHDKEAIKIKANDTVTYTIRVYNEGRENDYCGYAQEIVDYLPDGLTFVKVDESSANEWTTSNKAGDSVITLKYIGNETIYNNSLLDIYTSKLAKKDISENLYQTVSLVCKVNEKGLDGHKLTNRAEISKEVATDREGKIIEGVTDRDSTPGSLKNPEVTNYYDEYNEKYGIDDENKSYYAGEENGKFEDDIDFETVYVEVRGMIGLFKYEDVNKNGEFDEEDKVLKGAKFALKESADAEEFVTEEVVTDEKGTAVFEDLELGKTYYIVETESPEGFKKLENAIEAVSKETVELTDITDLVKIGNERITGKIGLFKYEDVNKNGEFDEEDKVLKGAKFALKESADAEEFVTEEVVTDEKGTAVFEDLELGKTYYIVETESPEGFRKLQNAIEAEAKEVVELTDITDLVKIGNERIPGNIGIFKYEDVNKNGKFDKEDKALKGAKFALKESADAEEFVTEEVETDEKGTAVFKGLELGKTYYIVETESPKGFKKLDNAIEAVAKEVVELTDITDLVKIGNKKENKSPETTEVSGIKTWNDNDDADKIRPEKITIYLLADGVKVDSKEISKDDNWKFTFNKLPKYNEEGKEIVYTVDESEIEGYVKTIKGYNLTNTHISKPTPTEVEGVKTWDDSDNKYGKRPEKITIYLLANGERVDSREISEENSWTYKFDNLAVKDEEGNPIIYTVDESEVEGYTKAIDGYNIKNTYTPETIEIEGNKTWVDENNKDGIRPEVVRITLYADGEIYTSTITSEAQDWKFKFQKLPKYNEEGNEIVYTIDEDVVSGYTKKINGYNLTNTHIVKKKADLALRKFITEINSSGLEVSREPAVDVSTIATKGTATYTHPKNALLVNTGDVVTYTLRVYNEGKIDAYPSLIKDDIPVGLEFITDDAINTEYGWKMLDASGKETADVSNAKYVITDYLSKDQNEDKLLKAFDGETLDYQDVKVSFKVVSEDTTEKELINYAQISEETDAEGKKVEDSDSTPNRWINGEDDQDIEKIILTYADLALRKFITKINTASVVPSREPVVDVSPLQNGETTATYTHPKDVVNVSKDDIVTYTMRIYNEGSKDEFVTLVKDSIPEGLEFVPSSELNQKYNWVMVDETGNEVKYAENAKYVVTDYLKTDVIKAFNKETGELDYRDVEVEFRVVAPEKSRMIMTNQAQISAHTDTNGNTTKDRDSTPDEWIEGEDDQDIESVKLTYADLALRKFITEVDGEALAESRAPEVDVTNLVNETSTEAIYNHPKNAVEVQENDIVTYTLRIFNEGTKDVAPSIVKDDIPVGLEFVVDNAVNVEYRWKLLDENGVETSDVSAAKYITTDYLANEFITAFDKDSMETLDYRDVKVSFKVLPTVEAGKEITNYAQISEEKDTNGNTVTDIDSTPNEWIEGEDDQDTEKVLVKYFDLALKKWVSKAIVIENGKEKVVETGYNEETNPEPIVKVDLKKSSVDNVVVKFEYQIMVTNEGQVAGYATEVEDRIPEGLKFVQEDNPNWEYVDGRVVTHVLDNTLLEPGQKEYVTITLTWINKADNLGLKTNIAEITEHKDKKGRKITDIDSTPNNKVPGEDDIDDAAVMLTVRTGAGRVYIGLAIAVITILGTGIIGIKKYVLV